MNPNRHMQIHRNEHTETREAEQGNKINVQTHTKRRKTLTDENMQYAVRWTPAEKRR